MEYSYWSEASTHEPLLQGDGINYGMWRFVAVLFILTNLLTVISNIFCLIVLYRTKVLEEPTKVFMISLNAADLTSGLLVGIPSTIFWIIGWWPFGNVLCKIYESLSMDFLLVSLISVLLLTIDRYTAIYYPLRYPSLMTLTRARVMVCCNWGFILILMAIFFIIISNSVDKLESIYVYDDITGQWRDHQCFIEIHVTLNYGVYSILVFSIPTLIITILYIKIVLTALKHARQIRNEAQLGNRASGNQAARNCPNRSKRKSLITAAIITATLYFSFLPDTIFIILVNFLNIRASSEMLGLSTVVHLSNGWLNVVIYLFRNKQLRKEAKALLKCPCRKR